MRSTLAVLPVLFLGLLACGDDESSTGSGGGSTSSATSSGASTSTASSSSSSPTSSSSGEGAGDVGGGTSSSGGAGGTGGSDTGGGDTGGSDTGSGGAGGDGAGGDDFPICDSYPVELTFDDGQPAAQTELDTFAPDAELTWVPARGTLSSVSNLGVTLDCAGNGNDVWDSAWAVLEAHPDLFQLDRSEWNPGVEAPCSAITDLSILNTGRVELAGLGVQKDIIAIVVAPDDADGLELRGVNGYYLPALAPGDISACEPGSDDALEDAAREATFSYSTFFQCAPSGSGTYEPQANDVLSLGESTWTWDDGTGTVIATQLQSATLVIDPSNVDPDLEASDANCPADESGSERIYGFSLLLDPITGEVVSVTPGIGCIVCLQ